MQAVILEDRERPGVALLPVAGRPLIARQIQWLRSMGCASIAVEIGSGAESSETARWLSDNDGLAGVVRVALTARRIAPRELALRAGLAADQPVLVVPAGVVGAGDLAALVNDSTGETTVALWPPEPLAGSLGGAEVIVLPALEGASPRTRIDGPSWGVRVCAHDGALALSVAAIAGQLPRPEGSTRDPIQLHAAEREPGIWVGRGARIEAGATLIAPALIGARAVVCAGARVGPSAFVGERAVVEAGASLVESVAASGTIVGEGMRLERSVMDAHGVLDLDLAQHAEIEDSLLVSHRDAVAAVPLSSRAIGAACFALFAPMLLVAAVVAPVFGRRLITRADGRIGRRKVTLHEGTTGLAWIDLVVRSLDLALGRRSLVGLGRWAEARGNDVSAWLYEDATGGPLGMFTVDALLTPPGASTAARLRARLWYAHTKSVRGDLALVSALIRRQAPLREEQPSPLSP